jgi:ABC-2 type transport system ATP-binding protein
MSDPQRVTSLVSLENLTKHYGEVRAVDGISLEVKAGEIFGLLGHNGAGKTTTIRMLTGRTKPTSGSARISGFDIANEQARIRPLINLVFEDANLYERLTGRDNLALFAKLYNAPVSRIEQLLDTVGLSAAADRRVKTWSTGMRQRLLIARALVNNPQVLFLDEPTRGLDPSSSRELRDLMLRLASEGTTIILTTHYMNEADELCDRVAFLSRGKVVAMDSPRELKLRLGRRSANVLLESRETVRVDLDSETDAQRLKQWLGEGLVKTIHSEEGTLEDVFIAIAGPASRQ